MPIPPLLEDLLTAVGPSGHEQPAARVWRDAAAAFADVQSDSLGTSYARVLARGERPLRLALIAHIDEIGFQVTHIGEDGLLAFSVLGGVGAEALAHTRVLIAGREGLVPGVVGRREHAKSRRDEPGRLELSELYIDLGARNRPAASALVSPGDAGVWQGDPLELAGGRIASRALDNRLGAYAILEAARRIAEADGERPEVVAVAAVQEELNLAGARSAAYALQPRVALIVDVTHATDVPGADPTRVGEIALGAGAAITLGPVVNPRVSEMLVAAAREETIPTCIEVYSGATHTDADAVHATRAGVPSGVVSIPLRGMHSPSELCSLDDLEAVIRLLVAFALRLKPQTTFVR